MIPNIVMINAHSFHQCLSRLSVIHSSHYDFSIPDASMQSLNLAIQTFMSNAYRPDVHCTRILLCVKHFLKCLVITRKSIMHYGLWLYSCELLCLLEYRLRISDFSFLRNLGAYPEAGSIV